MSMLQVTDDTTMDDVMEALGHLAVSAPCAGRTSMCDAMLDAMLDRRGLDGVAQ